MVDDDVLLIALVARSPPTGPKRTKYKVEARVDIDHKTWSPKKIVASVGMASKVLQDFLRDIEFLPDFNGDISKDAIRDQLAEDDTFCLEEADGLDGVKREFKFLIKVTRVRI